MDYATGGLKSAGFYDARLLGLEGQTGLLKQGFRAKPTTHAGDWRIPHNEGVSLKRNVMVFTHIARPYAQVPRS